MSSFRFLTVGKEWTLDRTCRPAQSNRRVRHYHPRFSWDGQRINSWVSNWDWLPCPSNQRGTHWISLHRRLQLRSSHWSRLVHWTSSGLRSQIARNSAWSQGSIDHGVRSSAATAYLAPRYLNRGNLDVLINTKVARILQTSDSSKDFRTVELGKNAGKNFLVLLSHSCVQSLFS